MGHVGRLRVLLNRRISRLQYDRDGLRHVRNHAACCSKIKHDGQAAALQKHDVVWRNVAVVAIGLVHDGQRLRHAIDNAHQPHLVDALPDAIFLARQCFFQGVALVARHDHVGGATLLPEPVDLEQGRMVKLRQQPRLIDEAAHAHVKGLLMAVRRRHHAAVALAVGQG